MPKTRGFRLGRKLMKAFKWALMRKRKQGLLNPLEASSSSCRRSNKAMRKIQDWSCSLKRGVKKLCCGIPISGYERVGTKPFAAKPVTAVPKGYLAVYVGEKEGFLHRFLVPVVYFNHPLFVELLKEAEKEYGFHHPGGITIPCHLSDFKKVQARIAAGGGYRKQAVKCH